jgi:hypothetical protein
LTRFDLLPTPCGAGADARFESGFELNKSREDDFDFLEASANKAGPVKPSPNTVPAHGTEKNGATDFDSRSTKDDL